MELDEEEGLVVSNGSSMAPTPQDEEEDEWEQTGCTAVGSILVTDARAVAHAHAEDTGVVRNAQWRAVANIVTHADARVDVARDLTLAAIVDDRLPLGCCDDRCRTLARRATPAQIVVHSIG